MCVFPLQEPSDIDFRDEQELCDSPVEHLQVRFLWTITTHLPEIAEAWALFSEMTVHFCEHMLYGIMYPCCVISLWMCSALPGFWVRSDSVLISEAAVCGWMMLLVVFQSGWGLERCICGGGEGNKALVCSFITTWSESSFLSSARWSLRLFYGAWERIEKLKDSMLRDFSVVSMDVYCCLSFVAQQKCPKVSSQT